VLPTWRGLLYIEKASSPEFLLLLQNPHFLYFQRDKQKGEAGKKVLQTTFFINVIHPVIFLSHGDGA